MDLLHVEYLSQLSSKTILKESFRIKLELKDLITMFWSMDGAFRKDKNIGWRKIHGDQIGEKMAHSELKKELIISEFKVYAIGLHLMILGQKISEIRHFHSKRQSINN